MMLFLKSIASELLGCEGRVMIATRQASKKAGGSSKNNRQRSGRAKYYGIKVCDGQLIPAGTVLVKQRTLRSHPGENVRVGNTGNLYALVDGTVVVTWEHFKPISDHVWVRRSYSEHDPERPLYMKYFHVLTRPSTPKFRLIEEL